jgi:hypothetical protein
MRAWPEGDVDAIASLYAENALYSSFAFREPDRGLAGVRRYLTEQFAVESDVKCWFGQPIASGDRTAVEWWATWVEDGKPVTLAGTTVLRFDAGGRVVDHRDYWNSVERRQEPYDSW